MLSSDDYWYQWVIYRNHKAPSTGLTISSLGSSLFPLLYRSICFFTTEKKVLHHPQGCWNKILQWYLGYCFYKSNLHRKCFTSKNSVRSQMFQSESSITSRSILHEPKQWNLTHQEVNKVILTWECLPPTLINLRVCRHAASTHYDFTLKEKHETMRIVKQMITLV